MFAKLSLVAAALPFVHGLTLNTPSGVTSGGRTTISWTSVSTDPSFSLELNHPDFRAAIAIANNIDPLRQSSVDIEMPTVTEFDSQYTISAVNVSNINDVFSQTSDFAIDPPVSSSGSSSTLSASTSGSGTASGVSTTATSPASSTSGFGTTVSNSAASSAATSGSSSASSATASTTQINGALSFKTGSYSFNAGVFAAMVLSVAAGAATLL